MADPAELLQGTLDLLILKAVSLGPLHGYAVLLRIHQISRDQLRVQQGSLYPALYRLEHQGLIASEWGESENRRKAKFYTLTAGGRRRLKEEVAVLAAILERDRHRARRSAEGRRVTFLARLRSFLRATFRRGTFEREMDSELQFHLDARVADLVAGGLDRATAARQARRELGDPLRWKEEGREARGLALIDQVVTDARYGLRGLARQPAFAFAAISTLALAIAANTTMFAMTDAVLFRALPFADAGRLVWISSVRSDNPDAPFTLAEFMDYRESNTSLAGVAAYANWSASLSGEGVTERFQGARLSANAFGILGVPAAAGRLLSDADDRADAPRVAVISHRLWLQRFGGAMDVVGRQVRINGDPSTIVGVLPVHFPLPLRDIDVIAPLVPDRDPVRHLRASTNFLRLFGRLGPGVSAEQAQQELTTICARLREAFPVEYARKHAVSATPLTDAITGDLRPTMVLLLASVVVVLSTALANLLCLVLVRTSDRRAEMSIRIAMGASRPRLIRQLGVEAITLTIVAGALGAGLAALATSSATSWAPSSIPRLAEVRFDGRALFVASALTLAASVLFTLAPLGTLFRTRAHHALRLVSRGSIGDRWNHRLRDGLVVAEISAALVLLLATTLLVRDFVHLQRVDPGFTPDAVFQARVSLPLTYRSPADVTRFHDQLMMRLDQLPGVRDRGLISVAPMSGLSVTVPFSVVGQSADIQAARLPNANFRVVTPGYLAAAGTRIIRGRGFSDRDRADASKVALVSEAMAGRWLGTEPLGRQIMIDDNNTGPRPVEVVGVVENVRQTTMSGPAGLDLYIPLPQIHPDGVALIRDNQFWMIRSETGPEALRTSFVNALQAVDRDAAVSSMGTMRQGLETWFGPRRFSLALFVAFSLTAVLLAVSGLFGLVSYAVRQRRREIGLRMALGASAVDVRGLVLRDATRLAIIGITLGIMLALAARPLNSWLISDTAIEPVLTTVTTAALFVIVILAGAVPAHRASRIEPTVALKGD